jgi:hypothetical protein
MDKRVVELDVREDIKNKQEPFQKIMESITDLKEDDVFILHAPFKPAPLFAVMKSKGFEHEIEELDNEHFKVTFTKKA